MALLPTLIAAWAFWRFYTTGDLFWFAVCAALVMLAALAARKLRMAALAGVVAVASYAAVPGGYAQIQTAMHGPWGALAVALCVGLFIGWGFLMVCGISPRKADRAMTRPLRGDRT